MSEKTAELRAQQPADQELLTWENLGTQPAGLAFRRSLWDLMIRPSRFFRKMAITGGLHEPITFFAIILTAGIVMAFPAALAYFGLATPDPERMNPEAYGAYALPARLTGLLLAVLPLAIVGASVAMALLGTFFHMGGRPFGARTWEGSLSVWMYSASAALVPLVTAIGVVMAVALGGYLLSIPWPNAKGPAASVAQWTAGILLTAGVLTGLLLLTVDTVLGSMYAFQLDAVMGAAAGVAGLLVVGAVIGACVWSLGRGGAGLGLIISGAAVCAAVAFAVVCLMRSRRAEGSV